MSPEEQPQGAKADRRARWELTGESLDRLLRELDVDRERAGASYRRIHRRLVGFFERHGCREPEELADETINRVARRVGAGLELTGPDPYTFFHGVARNVLREYRKRVHDAGVVAGRLRFVVEDWAERSADERLFDALAECLGSLGEEKRELLVRYYAPEGDSRTGSRERLAEELGISLNALRIRACRARSELAARLRALLEEAEGGEEASRRPPRGAG